MAANPDPFTGKRLDGKRLDSWKEIAAFFGRAERTVKRWEIDRGLPVHRVPGSGRSSVFAYREELADWLKGRSQELEADEPAPQETLNPAESLIPVPAELAAPPRLNRARVAAWVVPMFLVAAVTVAFSFGSRGLHFKALANRHTPNAEAQDLYLKGRYYWNRRTPDDLNLAIDSFTQAIVKDPSDAQAYVGLADCYNLLREFGAMPPAEAYPRALSAAHRAVELDDSSAEAHISLAFGTYWWSWKAATAEREFKRALELDPSLVRAHHWYATYLMALGRNPESLDQIEQARRLDPSSTAILADKGYILWHDGRRTDGLALLKQLEVTEPSLSSTHVYLGNIYWRQKDYPNALAEWRRAAELRHDAAGLAIADAREKGFGTNGLPGLYESVLPVQKSLVDHGSGSAFDLAATYAALGRRQDALACLQLSFERREAAMLTADPISISDDPAYQKLRAQVNEQLAQ